MLYKLLAVSKYPVPQGVNIGDYVQALASSQFYPRVDGFIDRDEELSNYDGEPCKVIMNGWYMHKPKNWPPSSRIDPLFVAFHLNSLAKKELLSSESLSYLKQHEPIGCRDLNTLKLLKEKNIDAYFSGCMTLTLGEKYRSDVKEDKVYIVDPQLPVSFGVGSFFQAIGEIVVHPKDVFALYGKKQQLKLHQGRNFLKKMIKTALYYKEYTKIFDRELIMNAIYISQEDKYYSVDLKNDFERLKEAERLIRSYSKAKLVITSRIHCALPCLGLGTPVIYLDRVQDSDTSACRLGGLKDLFNAIKVDNGKLQLDFPISLPISSVNLPQNSNKWQKYAEALKARCKEFIKNNN